MPCTTPNRGLFSRSLYLSCKVREIGVCLKRRKSGLCFWKGEARQRRKQACQGGSDWLTKPEYYFFLSLDEESKPPQPRCLGYLLDALMLQRMEENNALPLLEAGISSKIRIRRAAAYSRAEPRGPTGSATRHLL